MVPKLPSLLLTYVLEEGRDGIRGKATTNFEGKKNKLQSTGPTKQKSMISSFKTGQFNALKHYEDNEPPG